MYGRSFSDLMNTETDLEFEQAAKEDRGEYFYFAGQLKKTKRQEAIPVTMLTPKNWNKQVVVWLDDDGKSAVVDAEKNANAKARAYLDKGFAIVAADLFMQGDFLGGQPAPTKARKVAEKRESAAYSFGYNYTLFAQRVQDVVSLVAFAKQHERAPSAIHLIALDGTGPIAATARALCVGNVQKAAIHTQGFRFAQVDDYLSVNFVPGAAKYGDLDGMLALGAQSPTVLIGEDGDSLPITAKAHKALGTGSNLTLSASANEVDLVDWLLK
jgi:hypothetical protein